MKKNTNKPARILKEIDKCGRVVSTRIQYDLDTMIRNSFNKNKKETT